MSTPASTAPPSPTPKKESTTLRSVLIACVIALTGIVLVLKAWEVGPFESSVVSTDNAYVRGQVTLISPQVSGYVTEVLVKDYEHVQQGQALVRIDRRSYAAAHAQAQLASAKAELANADQTQAQNHANLKSRQAALAAAQAEAERAEAEYRRIAALAKIGSVSLNERDRVRAAAKLALASLDQANADIAISQETIKFTEVNRGALEAAVQMAEAQLQQAEIDLENTTVYAPSSGQASEIAARPGQLVSAGTQLLYVVPETMWVIANFKETQTANIAIGQAASFTVDALDGAELHGTVEEIAPATGSEFAMLKADNATGNFTKVVQRLPVKIRITPGQPQAQRLRPGMSVIAHIDTAPHAPLPRGGNFPTHPMA